MTSATFTVSDDGRPEPDYTYTIQMRVASGDAVISQLRMATVTVVANNDPFGVFGFQIVRSWEILLDIDFSIILHVCILCKMFDDPFMIELFIQLPTITCNCCKAPVKIL